MKGLAAMALADHDQESSDYSFGQSKRARKSSDSLSSTTRGVFRGGALGLGPPFDSPA